MSSIFDYLEWRGDITFDEDPFNEVDNLVLSELAYACFEGIVPYDGEAVPLSEVRKAYFRKHPRSRIHDDDDHIAKSPLLMDSMVTGKRFADITMTGYVDIVDADEAVQMAAVTYFLGDGTAFIAFRGTDGTIAGSASNLYDCLLTAVRSGVPREEAILSATLNPAKALTAEDRIGSIEPGKCADFVVCDENLERRAVYVGGERAGKF